MNKLILTETGGFPLEVETLEFMQNAYDIFQSLGEIVGNKSIIKGCEIIGVTTTDGVIYLNGEMLRFKGGQTQSTIIIIETKTELPYEDGQVKPVEVDRYATFGAGIDAVDWSEFKRAYPLTSALFVGELRDYVGLIENIPWGWYLADGTNGTENMNDIFPIQYIAGHADYGVMCAEVGSNELTLAVGQLPKHKATGTTTAAGAHIHNLKDGEGGENTNSITLNGGSLSGQDRPTNWVSDNSIISESENHVHNFESNEIGNDEAIDIRPKRKVVAKIQFLGV
ncbi:MAG: hypothetical protein QM487_15315 [Candidatus Marithrix sp.]